MFFKYSKKAKLSGAIIATIYSLIFSVLLNIIIDFAINLILGFNKNNTFLKFIIFIISGCCFLVFEGIYFFTKKGIYLFDDCLILKNGYTETGINKFLNFSNMINFNDILDIEFYKTYKPICPSQEKFFGIKMRNSNYVILTVNTKPTNILLYISVENSIELYKALQNLQSNKKQ